MRKKRKNPCDTCDRKDAGEMCTPGKACEAWQEWFKAEWRAVTAPLRRIFGRNPKTGKKLRTESESEETAE